MTGPGMGLRTVANKLPQSHLRSMNQPDVSFKGPGGRFSDIMNNAKVIIPSEKSPIKTPIKQEGTINNSASDYSLFSKFRNIAGSTLIE